MRMQFNHEKIMINLISCQNKHFTLYAVWKKKWASPAGFDDCLLSGEWYNGMLFWRWSWTLSVWVELNVLFSQGPARTESDCC